MSLLLTRMFDPRPNVAALQEATGVLRRHRALVFEMTRRELLDRHVGTTFGLIWTILTPLLMFGANVFALMYVMRIRFSEHDTGLVYAIFVLTGMTPWLALSDAIGRATSVIVDSGGLVKQVVFPSEVLPLKIVFASIPSLLVGMLVVTMLNAFRGGIPATSLLAPVCILYQIILVAGFVYALAALGVFLRDVKDFVGVILGIGMFFHPIFYPPGSMPEWLSNVFMFSPFSHLIWCFHDAFFSSANSSTPGRGSSRRLLDCSCLYWAGGCFEL